MSGNIVNFEIKVDVNDVVRVGSDDESGLVNVTKKAFPQSSHYLCIRHLKDSVNRYLADKVGASERDRGKIISEIFGKSDLV